MCRGGCWLVVGEFGQMRARVGKSGQVWIGETDQAEMGDITSGWLCTHVPVGLR